MSKSYPRKSGKKQHKKNISAKCKCGEIGRWKVTIETSWFRGEDEVVWACDEHKDDVDYLYYDQDALAIAEDADREMLGDDFLLLQDHDIGNKS